MGIDKVAQSQLNEYYKCKNDLLYFIEHYVKVELPGGSIHPTLYSPQKTLLKMLMNDHYVSLLKTRQTGGSTAAQFFCTWALTFFKNVVVGVVSRKGDEATDFARKVMTMIHSLPIWMQPRFTKDTERTFILDNGSKFFAEGVHLVNPGSLFRGKSIGICIIDEAAYINAIDIAYTAFAPALFKAHQVSEQNGIPYCALVISTPNRMVGIGKWYYELWQESLEGSGMYKPCKLYWKDIPEFKDDPTWYETQCKVLNNDRGKIAQELEMQFLGSSDSWLPLDTIEKLYASIKKPKVKLKMMGGFLHQWKDLDISRYYIIGVDTASAGGGDKSAIEIFDYETFEQVAEFRGKLEVFDFCQNIKTICKLYPKHIIIPEDNSYGMEVVGFLRRIEENSNMVNLYKMHPTKLLRESTSKVLRYGLNTNIKTRPLMMDALYTFITQFPESIKSEALVLELAGLVEKAVGTSFKVEADKGMNDDLALSLAFICYVRHYDPPMGIPNSVNEKILDDAIDISGWNDESPITEQMSPYITEHISDPNNVSIKTVNNALHKHIKKNLHEITKRQVDNPMDDRQGFVDMFKVLNDNNL